MLIGKSVILRAIEPGDLDMLRQWRNQSNLRTFFREHTELSSQDQLTWYNQIVLPKKNVFMFSIINKETNVLMGACGLCYIDWLRKSADLSIYLGWENIYLDEVFAMESAKLLIKYAFAELGLHRIWAEVYSHDMKKQDFFHQLGFLVDGRFRESHWTENKWVDSIFYSRLSTDTIKD